MRKHRLAIVGRIFLLALAVLLVWPSATLARDEIPVRLRHFEGSVTVQRAAEAGSEAAATNVPLYAGDRLWTEDRGRAELVFDDGTFVWLDRRSKLDLVALDSSDHDDARVLRLWSGSLLLTTERERGIRPVRIDTPTGTAVVDGDALVRVDVEENRRTWLSVYRGHAELVAGGLSEPLAAGERSYAEAGTAPARATSFNTAEGDAFTDWQARRLDSFQTAERYVSRRSYVPREIVHHVVDLEPHGNWIYYDAFDSWCWRPRISVSWSPYRHGRWVFGSHGWVWVPFRSWGWVTVHYGRWHHLPAHGWVWFPGRVWSPAWVQWRLSARYVGWAPLNFFNRPVVHFDRFVHHRDRFPGRHSGRAIGRGKVVQGQGHTREPDAAWTFVPSDRLGAGDVRRVAVDRNAVARDDAAGGSPRSLINGPMRLRDPGSTMRAVGRRAVRRSDDPLPATTRDREGNGIRGPGSRTGSSSTTSPLGTDARRGESGRLAPRATEGTHPSRSRSDDGRRTALPRAREGDVPEARARRPEPPRSRVLPRAGESPDDRRAGRGEIRTPNRDRAYRRPRAPSDLTPRTSAAPWRDPRSSGNGRASPGARIDPRDPRVPGAERIDPGDPYRGARPGLDRDRSARPSIRRPPRRSRTSGDSSRGRSSVAPARRPPTSVTPRTRSGSTLRPRTSVRRPTIPRVQAPRSRSRPARPSIRAPSRRARPDSSRSRGGGSGTRRARERGDGDS